MSGETLGALCLALLTVAAAVAAVVAFVTQGGLDSLPAIANTARTVGLVLALGVAVRVALAVTGAFKPRTREVRFHAHGPGRNVILRHEAGHAIAIERFGGRVTKVEIGDDWGVTHGTVPANIDPLDDAAIDYAGGTAARTWWGCGSDKDHARSRINGAVPFTFWGSERSAAHAEAKRRARGLVGGMLFDGGVGAAARRIDRTGKY